MARGYDPMSVLPRFYQINASDLNCEEYLEKVTGVAFKTLLTDFYTAIAAGEHLALTVFTETGWQHRKQRLILFL